MCHCRNVNMPHSTMKSLLLWVISAIAMLRRVITFQNHFLHRLFWLRVAKGPHNYADTSGAFLKWYVAGDPRCWGGCTLNGNDCAVSDKVVVQSNIRRGSKPATLMRVNTQQVEMDTKFGTAHRAVQILDKFEYAMPHDLRKQFNNAPLRWSNLKKRVALGKQRIGPRIQAKGDLISQDLSRFGEIFTSLRARFSCSKCLRHDFPRDKAMEMLGDYVLELKALQTQAKDLIELQELLETSIFNFSLLKELEDELSTLHELWNMFELILGQHRTWHKFLWSDIDMAQLLEGVDKQMQMLSGLPDKIVQDWGVYQYLRQTVGTMRISLPMVEGLKSPAMRPRHWKQVLRYATTPSHLLGRGGTFDPNLLEELTFGQLLEMNLHSHIDDVCSLVERANKDVAIESLLNTFEEVWLSRQLELKVHKRAHDSQPEAISDLGVDAMSHASATPKSRAPSARVTSGVRRLPNVTYPTISATPGGIGPTQPSVLLLSNTGGIFETLESHQTSLQSLDGTVAAVSFADELHKWHKQLQTIEAVLVAWLKVQQLWVQLEEVYQSSDIQQQLSSCAFSFTNADREFKELMSLTAKNPAVLAVCLKDGLLLTLDKLRSSLSQCQAALVQYVAGQRLKSPWFYLLPLEDILQLVCYGSSLQQLSKYIPVLLRHVSNLEFDGDVPVYSIDHTPKGKGGASMVTAVVGRSGEKLELGQPVMCEGPIEGIVSNLLLSASSTLQSHLSTAVSSCTKRSSPSSRPADPSLSTLHGLWSSSLPSHTILLTTLIVLEDSLLKASQDTTDKRTLDDLSKDLNASLKALSTLLQGRSLEEEGEGRNSNLQSEESRSHVESSVKASASSAVDSTESSSMMSDDRGPSRNRDTDNQQISSDKLSRLHRIAFVLYGYKHKVNQLRLLVDSEPITMLHKSLNWKSTLHFTWDAKNRTCVASALGVSLPCECGYSDGMRAFLSVAQSEAALCSILQAVESGYNILLTGHTSIGKHSVVRELSIYAGRLLLFFHCSPQVSYATLLNLIRGMAATGCWLYLHSINHLQPHVLQATCLLLCLVQQARQRREANLEWMGEKIKLSVEHPGCCIASINTPLSFPDYTTSPVLPSALAGAFQACSVEVPDTVEILKVMFATKQFQNAAGLAESLSTFCSALEELRTPLMAIESLPGNSLPPQLSLYCMEMIVSLSQKHMHEFYSVGAISDDEDDSQRMGGDNLHMPSVVYSEISQSTHASIRGRYSASNGEEDVSQQKSLQKQSLEEFSLVLALKDSILCSVPPGSKEYPVIVRLIRDLFPNCDIQGLLSHETAVREGMAVKARQNREAVESARESRAASVMQMMREDNFPSEAVGNLEDQIVQSCHLHHFVPTPNFQAAVAQVVNLVQVSRFVAVCGSSNSGKTAAIQVAADTFRQSSNLSQTCCVSTTTIAVGSMREEQLFGYQSQEKGLWQDGVLPRLLTSSLSTNTEDSSKGIPASHWFILEGSPTHKQMEVLSSCCADDCLTLSNGHSVPIDSSIRFILELPDPAVLPPSLAAKTARVVLSQDAISWRDVLFKWLHGSVPDFKTSLWETIEALFLKYLPPTLEFISPALLQDSHQVFTGVSTTSVGSNNTATTLEHQELRLTPVQLVNSCCRILQSLLPTPTTIESEEEIEHHFIYSMVWACGGFLSTTNKAIFNQWWRATFTSRAHQYPQGGAVWDYYTKPGTKGFFSWKKTLHPFSPPSDKTAPPFVHTVRGMATIHLTSLLISRGYPVLIGGVGGSGKTSLLQQFLGEFCRAGTGTNLLHVYCNLLTSAEVIWNQIVDCLEWDWGKKYTPKGCKRLVCFIDDLHNTQDPSCCELLRQHLATGEVCDPGSGKWHDMSDVCYLVTADHASRTSSLPAQLLKQFVVLQWDEYSSEELVYILDTMLRTYCFSTPSVSRPQTPATAESPVTSPQHRTLSSEQCTQLVRASVQIHSKLEGMFLATPERLHYRFTLHDLMAVFRHLCARHSAGAAINQQQFLLEWQQGVWWKWAGQMSSQVDRDRYWELLSHALRKYFNQDKVLPLLLAESSSRLSTDAISELRMKLKNEMYEYSLSHPTLHVNLYDNTVEEIRYLCHVINSPPDLGHVMMLGHAHPEPLIRLASLHCGYSVVQTLQNSNHTLQHSNDPNGMSAVKYSIPQFRRDLIAISTTAGVRNERLVLLLTDKQIFSESFLTCIYEFVKGSAISALFSKEEQAKIINGVRGDMTQSGITFSAESAWSFFLSRVRCNLRVVVSLPELRATIKSGCYKWNELLSSMAIYNELPWERKTLLQVATYHLEACAYLTAGQVESLAHLLASIHLLLKAKKNVAVSNTAYQYFVERFVHELSGIEQSSQKQSSELSLALSCHTHAVEKASCLEERIHRETVVLGEKSEACIKLLVQIGQDTAISSQHSKLVAKQKERIAHLMKVTPDFEHAHYLAVQEKEKLVSMSRELVQQMDQQSLAELRSLQRPPPDIEELLVAVITILKGTAADFSWTKGAKRLMANLDRFRELLLEFSAHEEHSETLLEVLDPMVMKSSFSAESLSRHPTIGLAASQLSQWVQGVVKLHSTLQGKIRPLHLKVDNMQASLKEYSDKLKKEENKVSVLEDRLKGLSAALENASVEKSKQRTLLSSMKKELKETQDFIHCLSGLHTDWSGRLESSNTAVSHSVGSLCLATTLACYLGSVEPHEQMEVVNGHLVPMLRERGVTLHWRMANEFVRTIADIGNGTPLGSGDDKTGEEDEDMDSIADTQSLPCRTALQDCEDMLSRSHASLSGCLLAHMIPERLANDWLSAPSTHHSLSYLLCSALVHSSWNRWPLVLDPQDLASQCIRQCNKELICLDATDRSSSFYLSLEHALVHGEAVMVTHFPCPVDPTLQPLIELGHTWDADGTKVAQFCGHRLHVHPRFRLYLTTVSPLSSIPASLLSDLNVINLSPSIPLSQDVLLNETIRVLLPDESSHFVVVCEEIARGKERLGALEAELFASLPKEGRTESYWQSTEKISKIVDQKMEVCTQLQSSAEALRQSCQLMSKLLPVARYGALVYSTWGQIARLAPQKVLSWQHILVLFSTALSQCVKSHSDLSRTVGSGNGKAVCGGAIHQLNQALLQHAFRCMDESTWKMLACSMALLTECELSQGNTTVALAEQLLYLAHGEEVLSELTSDQETPPPEDSDIPQELWELLQKIPLSFEYYEQVEKSLKTHPQFWEDIGASSNGGGPMDPSDFPWKVNGDLTFGIGLDDYVMLKCLNESSWLAKLSKLVSSLVEPVAIPQLGEMLLAEQEGPTLLIYEEACPRSQATMFALEEEIKSILKERNVVSVSVSAGVEEEASKLLCQPKSDVLLLLDVQYGSKQWLDLLLWRTKQAQQSNCRVIFTASSHSILPDDLLTSCHMAHLSRLATSSTHSLPKQAWMVDSYADNPSSFKHLLCYNLAILPKHLLSEAERLPNILQPVLFNLAVLHTAVALLPSRGDDLAPVHYSYFLTAVYKLLSTAEHTLHCTSSTEKVGAEERTEAVSQSTLHYLSTLVLDVYSGCAPRDKLLAVMQEILSVKSCSLNAHIRPHPDVELITPASAISNDRFTKHIESTSVGNTSKHDQDSQSRSYSVEVKGAIESLLLPVLTRVPSPELYDLPSTASSSIPPPPPSPSTPSHHQLSARSRDVVRTLEYCSEQLPLPLSLPGEISEATRGLLMGKTRLCSQMNSMVDYHSHVHQLSVHHFNSTLLSIHRDIEIVTKSAAVGFDGLAEELLSVLASVEAGNMPRRWRAKPRLHPLLPVTLDQGLQEFSEWRFTLD